MKTPDYMIGDWIVYKGDTEYDNPIKIEGMDIATDMLITSDREDVGFNGVEPIPLTAEILKKNGWIVWKANKMGVLIFTQHFEFSDNLLGIKDSIESRIDCDPYGDFHYMCNGKSLCYINSVHELQHVLKLCKIDKTIKL